MFFPVVILGVFRRFFSPFRSCVLFFFLFTFSFLANSDICLMYHFLFFATQNLVYPSDDTDHHSCSLSVCLYGWDRDQQTDGWLGLIERGLDK